MRDGKLVQMPHSCYHVETIRHPIRWLQKCEEDGDQWDGEAAMHGGGRGIR